VNNKHLSPHNEINNLRLNFFDSSSLSSKSINGHAIYSEIIVRQSFEAEPINASQNTSLSYQDENIYGDSSHVSYV